MESLLLRRCLEVRCHGVLLGVWPRKSLENNEVSCLLYNCCAVHYIQYVCLIVSSLHIVHLVFFPPFFRFSCHQFSKTRTASPEGECAYLYFNTEFCIFLFTFYVPFIFHVCVCTHVSLPYSLTPSLPPSLAPSLPPSLFHSLPP